MIRMLVFALLRLTLIPWALRESVSRTKVAIIFYHEVKPAVLRSHIRALKSRYNIVSLRDYVTARRQGTLSSLPPKSLIITFDDGHVSNYALKPLLAEYGVPATIFICSDLIGTHRHFWFNHGLDKAGIDRLRSLPDEDRLEFLKTLGFESDGEFDDRQAMSVAELRDMEALVDFQGHTASHPALPRCSDERAREEIAGARRALEEGFGLDIYALSYPFGDYCERDVAMARAAGYDCALTVEPGLNSDDTDLFRLKRIWIPDDADVNELVVRSSLLWEAVKSFVRGLPKIRSGQ